MMRGGRPMHAMWRRDRSVLEEELKPGTMRRVMRLALDYRGMLALFLVFVVVDAVLTTINPLILPRHHQRRHRRSRQQLIVELALLAALVATLDMAVSLVQRYMSARIGEGADLRPAHARCSPTCSGCRSRSSPARRPARWSAGSTTTSSARSRRSRRRSASVVEQRHHRGVVLVAMLVLSWQITLASLVLLPLFVLPGAPAWAAGSRRSRASATDSTPR